MDRSVTEKIAAGLAAVPGIRRRNEAHTSLWAYSASEALLCDALEAAQRELESTTSALIEAQIENKRLAGLIEGRDRVMAKMSTRANNLRDQLRAAQAEIERLKDERATFEQDAKAKALQESHSLIERLREDEKRLGFYVASRASIPERGQMWRDLAASGVPINSSWIYEDGDGQTRDFAELWSRICAEVTRSSAVILYAQAEDFPLKGAFIEVGMALAAGIPIYVVLPGVEIEPRSCRPIGSWIQHPLVRRVSSVREAIDAALPAPAATKEGERETQLR